MKIKKIVVYNYKGIGNINIEFNNGLRVKTLVGLNESGKTSILKAIEFIMGSDNEEGIINQLVPKSKKANFNGSIKVIIFFEVNEKLRNEIKKEINNSEENNYNFVSMGNEITYSRTFSFENGNMVSEGLHNRFCMDIKIKKSSYGKQEYLLSDVDEVFNRHIWSIIEAKFFPNIFLFKTLSSNMPNKIFLRKQDDELDTDKNWNYTEFIEHFFKICEPNLDFDSIIERIEGAKKGNEDDRDKIVSTILKVKRRLNEDIMKEWKNIVGEQSSNINIDISYGVDDNKGAYIEIRVEHNSESFNIHERSLGFNWFVTFLAFVYFKSHSPKSSTKQNIFLLDEPASNLHPAAQERLLEKIEEIIENENNIVIYTTHSQYLINPKWLMNTYIVKNDAMSDMGIDIEGKTKISLKKYSKFVGDSNEKDTHFQPILNAIDYVPSKLENIPNVLMVEGKNDYYTLKYISEHYLNKNDIHILPGTSADNLERNIGLYLAWGRNFIVLLDSDGKGKAIKNKLEGCFGHDVKNKIFLISDIITDFSGTLENVFEGLDKMRVIKSVYSEEKNYTKNKFNKAIEYLYATGSKVNKYKNYELTKGTLGKIKKIIEKYEKEIRIQKINLDREKNNENKE